MPSRRVTATTYANVLSCAASIRLHLHPAQEREVIRLLRDEDSIPLSAVSLLYDHDTTVDFGFD